MIKRSELRRGDIYRLRARNIRYGVWDGDSQFIGIRDKFGLRLDAESLDDPEFAPYNTAVALERVGEVPEGIELSDYLPTVDATTGRRVIFCRPLDQGGRGWVFVDTDEPSVEIRPVTRMNQQLFDVLRPFGGRSLVIEHPTRTSRK
jgi:hypothetical protein